MTGPLTIGRNNSMREIFFVLALLGGWIVLNVWILPRFGVST